MILSVQNDRPCQVFDANGKPLEYVVWCDTETGEAVHLVIPLEEVVGEDGTPEARKEWRQHPAPLSFVRGTAEICFRNNRSKF